MSSSLGRIGAIARTTFIELARLRVFYVLVLFALVLIISSSFLARISFQQELQVTKDIALGAINFFLSMLAIVATATFAAGSGRPRHLQRAGEAGPAFRIHAR